MWPALKQIFEDTAFTDSIRHVLGWFVFIYSFKTDIYWAPMMPLHVTGIEREAIVSAFALALGHRRRSLCWVFPGFARTALHTSSGFLFCTKSRGIISPRGPSALYVSLVLLMGTSRCLCPSVCQEAKLRWLCQWDLEHLCWHCWTPLGLSHCWHLPAVSRQHHTSAEADSRGVEVVNHFPG